MSCVRSPPAASIGFTPGAAFIALLALFHLNCAHMREPVKTESYDANSICQRSKTSGSSQQHKLCRQEPEIVREISSGISMAVAECQTRFRSARWNCSAERGNVRKLMETATRESGFLRAVISAGILQSIAEGCSAGRLPLCLCGGGGGGGREGPTEDTVPDDDQWVWGGCNDADHFAQMKAKEFTDDVIKSTAAAAVTSSPARPDFRLIVYRHNNEAGRLATRNYMRRVCKCHGLSGSCALQTCWLRMPRFSEVGQRLKDRYDGAIQVTVGNPTGSRMTPAAGGAFKDPDEEDIVFSQSSPDYCRANRKEGVMGTKGRDCDPASIGVGGCGILCCGRGYRTRKVTVVNNCNCKFRWCCDVVCQTCPTKITVHRCK